MKKSNLLFVALVAVVSFIGLSFKNIPSKTVNIDLKASQVSWVGYKVTGKHNGTVSLKSGNLEFKGNVLTGGSFEIDMNSITVADLSGNGKANLEKHLKSEDFFSTATFQVAKFKITKATSKGNGNYNLVGNLTIKDKTQEMNFDAKVLNTGGKITADASLKIDRTKFGIQYRSGKFFEALGDKLINDEFDLNVKLVGN
jgi:polyisoprenoid-binding protein YceI